MNKILEKKKEQFLTFIDRVIKDRPAIRGVVVVGSIAHGQAREDSDIDCYVFMDPVNLYLIPAEAKWELSTGKFYPYNQIVKSDYIQVDCKRVDYKKWGDKKFIWKEEICAELAKGWVVFDRDGEVKKLVAQKTKYKDDLVLPRLDDALIWLGNTLCLDRPERTWDTLGPTVAQRRLNVAYDYLIKTLFAYNKSWCPWPGREIPYLLTLTWLPNNFESRLSKIIVPANNTKSGYLNRSNEMISLFEEIQTELVKAGLYKSSPLSEAFGRVYDEPGRAWNMDEWNKYNKGRL